MKEDENKNSSRDDKSKNNDDDDDSESVGSTTIKTAKNMQESNAYRRIMYTSSVRCCYLHILVIICCIIDSEVRWNCKDIFEKPGFKPYEHFAFFLLNSLRVICLVAVTFTLRYSYIWHMANIKVLK